MTYLRSAASREAASVSSSVIAVPGGISRLKRVSSQRVRLETVRVGVPDPHVISRDLAVRDLVDPVTRRTVRLVEVIRPRCNTANRHVAGRACEHLGHVAVLVAVDDQIGTELVDHLGECLMVAQPTDPALGGAPGRRVMDRDDPDLAVEPRIAEDLLQAGKLRLADAAISREPRRRAG